MRRSAAALLTAVAVLAACAPGGDETRTVSGAVAPKTVTVHVPAEATTIGVVVLHSYGHTQTEPVTQGWNDASDRHGFVAIYPSGNGSWNAGLCCGSAAATHRDDVGWLGSVIFDAKQRYGLTTVYVAGYSNGGMEALRLVAERPATASRLAVWGAAPEMPTPGRWTGIGVLYNGETDTTVPADGGIVRLNGLTAPVRPVATTPQWLLGAHLQRFIVPGAGHRPPADWPELAWRALTAPPGLAPSS